MSTQICPHCNLRPAWYRSRYGLCMRCQHEKTLDDAPPPRQHLCEACKTPLASKHRTMCSACIIQLRSPAPGKRQSVEPWRTAPEVMPAQSNPKTGPTWTCRFCRSTDGGHEPGCIGLCPDCQNLAKHERCSLCSALIGEYHYARRGAMTPQGRALCHICYQKCLTELRRAA